MREAGPRLSVPPELAAAIMKHFEKIKCAQAEEYFAGRNPLFAPPQPVSDADVNALLELKCSDSMDIAYKLWGEQERKLQNFEGRAKESAHAIDGVRRATCHREQDDY
jgi:hypothetical protein